MAQGPFIIDTSVAPIRGEQLQGGAGFTPRDTTITEAVAGVIQGVGGLLAYKQGQEKQATLAKASQQFGDLATAMFVRKFPSLAGSPAIGDVARDPAVRTAVSSADKFSQAVDSGAMTRQEAVLRSQMALRQAIAESPQYAPELTQIMRDTMGFTPSAKMMEYLAEKTPEEKAYESVAIDAAKHGVSVETYQLYQANQLQMDAQIKALDFEKKSGEYNANTFGQQAELMASQYTTNFLTEMNNLAASGSRIDDPDALKNQVAQRFAEMKQQLLANMPRGVDAQVVRAQLDRLTQLEGDITSGIDNGSTLKFLKSMNERDKQFLINNTKSVPGLFEGVTLFGNAYLPVLHLAQQRKNDPKKYSVVAGGPQSSALSVIDELASLRAGAEYYNPRSGGLNAAAPTGRELNDAVQVGVTMVESGQLPDGMLIPTVTRLQQLTGENEVTVATLSRPGMVNQVAKEKNLWPSMANLYNSQFNVLINQYAQMVRDGKLPEEQLRVEDGQIAPAQGRIVPDASSYSGHATVGLGSKEFETWRGNMNRLFRFAEQYRTIGAISTSVYTTPSDMLLTMQEAAQQAIEEAKARPQPQQVAREQYGNIVVFKLGQNGKLERN